MRQDFSKIEDAEAFLVPDGCYLCRVAEVVAGNARDGSERWSFRLEAAEGERIGRTLAWDSITWSERGMYRVKSVLGVLGFDVSGPLEIEAQELSGRVAIAELRQEEWEDPTSGRRQRRMAVPYLGYEAAPEGARERADWSVERERGASAIGEPRLGEVLDEVLGEVPGDVPGRPGPEPDPDDDLPF